MDFAVTQLPGWHTTVFPPYFVAGAIFSGFAMVVTLMVICRWAFGLQQIITLRHFDYMAKIIHVTSWMVGYAYGLEMFTAWYSGNRYEIDVFRNRAFGDYAWAYWTMVTCNVVVPQLLWLSRVRASLLALFLVSILVNVGKWFERFVIIVSSGVVPLRRAEAVASSRARGVEPSARRRAEPAASSRARGVEPSPWRRAEPVAPSRARGV